MIDKFKPWLEKAELAKNTLQSYLWTVKHYLASYSEPNKENLMAYKCHQWNMLILKRLTHGCGVSTSILIIFGKTNSNVVREGLGERFPGEIHDISLGRSDGPRKYRDYQNLLTKEGY